MKEVKVAMIGFGGIAKVHNQGYHTLVDQGVPVKLVALCDVDKTKFVSSTEINLGKVDSAIFPDTKLYTDVDELLANEEFDMADICLPDYLHKDMTIKMLRAGKHVFVEKPMALNGPDCDEMIAVANEVGKRLMVGQCLRFASDTLYLKECVDTGRFGKLRNIFMNRFSINPTWGFEDFYRKTDKCGGSIMNLHIHDLDRARFILGEPQSVSAIANDEITKWIAVNSRLMYEDCFVVANATFFEADGVPFTANLRARFEKASVICDHKGFWVYPVDGEPFQPELPDVDCYTEEIRYMINLVLDESIVNKCNTPESAGMSVKLVETLRKSIALGGTPVVM